MEDYLKQLAEYMQNNQSQRKEEREVLSDTPQMGMPFTKKLKQQNPGLPESDISDYREGVKSGTDDYLAGIGPQQGFNNIAAKASRSVVESIPRFKKMFDIKEKSLGENVINKLSKPFKTIVNYDDIDKIRELNAFKEASKSGPKLISEEELIKNLIPEVDEFTRNRMRNRTDVNLAADLQEQALKEAQDRVAKYGQSKDAQELTSVIKKAK
jgi:hypothetical protein